MRAFSCRCMFSRLKLGTVTTLLLCLLLPQSLSGSLAPAVYVHHTADAWQEGARSSLLITGGTRRA